MNLNYKLKVIYEQLNNADRQKADKMLAKYKNSLVVLEKTAAAFENVVKNKR